MSDDPAFHAAMEKVGTELTWATAWEDVSVDEIIRLALEAARPIIAAEAYRAAADEIDKKQPLHRSISVWLRENAVLLVAFGFRSVRPGVPSLSDPPSRAAVRTEPEQ